MPYFIEFIDRVTGHKEEELIYGKHFLHLLYGDTLLSRLIGSPLAYAIARISFFSSFYGYLQSRPTSAKKIGPFIKKFHVNSSEFAEPVSSFKSFNDFFTRKLKSDARVIDKRPDRAIIPADGRYLFYQQLDQSDGFVIKGKKFDLAKLLDSPKLADEYADGSMAIARLCPTDYHRYHFPCNCKPRETKLINGWLYSVNPIAIKKNVQIFSENKRTLCVLDTERFGSVLFLEIGASFVGAIHQTYDPFNYYLKGDEKGYFSFGASSLLLIFPKGAIQFDSELIEATSKGFEIKCLLGQSMGVVA